MSDEYSQEDIQDNEAPLEGALPVSEDDTAQMSDDEFTEFMNRQLGNDHSIPSDSQPNGEEGEPVGETDQETTQSSDEVVDDVEGDSSEDEPNEPEVSDSTDGYTFKIGGQDITVSDEEDVKRLIERGLNSASEQQRLQPLRRVSQMLENNGLMDEEKLNFLIDVANGDKGAIAKLLKDKEIDSFDLGEEETEQYTPKDHKVSDEQVYLNQVIDELQDTEAFSTTANVVMEQWDEKSKNEFVSQPDNFKVLNQQVADGTYDAINNEITQMKLLGKLPSGSSFDVYKHVGDLLYSRNGLPGQTPVAQEQAQQGPSATDRLQQAAKQQVRRKKAVAPTRSAPVAVSQQTNAVDEALYQSDEDFLKATAHLFSQL